MARRRRRASKAERERQRGRLLAAVLAAAALAVLAAVLLLPRHSGAAPSTGNERLALIADGLSEDFPNATLINDLKHMLEEAGFKVVVKEGRQVNLKLYEELTKYSVVILRVHGGIALEYTPQGVEYFGGIFTGLPWRNNYTKLGEQRYVAKARPLLAPHKLYVAVLPRFFQEKLQGRFPNQSVMIVSACWATADPKTIAALFNHGLGMYIGWNHKVTVKHADQALYMLVKYALQELREGKPWYQAWEDAVYKVNTVLGPDPQTHALLFYALRSHYVSTNKT